MMYKILVMTLTTNPEDLIDGTLTKSEETPTLVYVAKARVEPGFPTYTIKNSICWLTNTTI